MPSNNLTTPQERKSPWASAWNTSPAARVDDKSTRALEADFGITEFTGRS